MADFHKMYLKLFQSQTTAIRILQDAQREAEDLYIESRDADIRILQPKEETDKDGE